MDYNQHTHPALTGGQFALIGGAGPKYRPEIQGGHKGLEQYLAERGFKYEQTHGKYEPSFIVHNIPRDQAMEIGRKAGQESVIHSNIGQHELVYVNGPNAGKHHPGTGHQFFHHPPQDGGTFVHIPNAGYVRFGFDQSKLLDVPKKGQDMLHTKNEVTVADFKKALAKSLQGRIDKYSESLVELAKTEVANSDGQPSVGELRLTKSNFSIEIPDTVCPTCFQDDAPGTCACLTSTGLTKSAFGLTVAAAMKRVYDSYHRNVAQPMFPNEPERAHELAMQVATDWATRVKDPRAIQTMALGHAGDNYGASEHDTTPSTVASPDSMSPAPIAPKPPGYALVDEATAGKLGVPFKGGNYTANDQHGNVTTNPGATLHQPPPVAKGELDKSFKGKAAAVGAAAALAAGAVAGGTASTPSDKEIKAHTSKFTQDKDNQPPANPHTKYHKTEGEPEMCKTCKSEMCKCMGKIERPPVKPEREVNRRKDWEKRREVDNEKDKAKLEDYAARGYDTTIKNTDWSAELGKNDEWMEKTAPPGFGEDTMHKLKGKYGTESAFKIAWAAYKKKNHGKKVEKGELFIDLKNDGAPPTSTDQAKTGGPRVKNVGYETDKPAQPSKDVPGKLDEGSGGNIAKGKSMKKAAIPASTPPVTAPHTVAALRAKTRQPAAWAGQETYAPAQTHEVGNDQLAPPAMPAKKSFDVTPGAPTTGALSSSEMAKAGPPMAKPPGGGTGLTPKKPGQSKPGSAKPIATAPKIAKPPKMGAAPKVALGKAALPPTPGANVTGSASIAAASKQPIQSMTGAVPKLTPAQMGPGSSGLSLAPPKPQTQGVSALSPGRTSQIGAAFTPGKVMGKSEEQFEDLKKSLGSCLNCGKTEHPGVCNAT